MPLFRASRCLALLLLAAAALAAAQPALAQVRIVDDRGQAVTLPAPAAFAPDRLDVMMRPGPRLDETADEVLACLARLSTRLP